MASVTLGNSGIQTAGSPFVTGAFTPAVGDLLVAFVGIAGTDAGPPAITDDQSGIWSQVDTFRSHAAALTGGLRAYVRNGPVVATSMTVTATQAGATGGAIVVLRVAGMANFGTAAVRSKGGQADQASGTPAPLLDLTPLSTNPVLIGVMTNTNGTANAAPRSSPLYTEDFDQGHATPATGYEVQHVDSGESSATLTTGGAAPSEFASIGIELDAFITAAPRARSPVLNMLGMFRLPLMPRLPFPLPSAPSVTTQLFLQDVTANATVSATLQKQVNKPVSTTVTSSATMVRQVGKVFSATVTSTASIVKQVGKSLTATVTVTASILAQKVKMQALTATVTTTATIVKQANKFLTATTVTSTASIVKRVNKNMSATVTLTATLAAIKVILRTLTATVTTTATMIRQARITLSSTVTLSASLVKQVGKRLTATVTSTATLSALKVILRTLSATVTVTATMTRRVGKTLSATATTTASLVKSVGKTLSGTVSTLASIVTAFIGPAPTVVAASATVLDATPYALAITEAAGAAVSAQDAQTVTVTAADAQGSEASAQDATGADVQVADLTP